MTFDEKTLRITQHNLQTLGEKQVSLEADMDKMLCVLRCRRTKVSDPCVKAQIDHYINAVELTLNTLTSIDDTYFIRQEELNY